MPSYSPSSELTHHRSRTDDHNSFQHLAKYFIQYCRPQLLGYLQEQMYVWKPRTLRKLFTPGYYNRGAWFINFFGICFGIIASIALVISVIQLGIAIVMLKLAYE
jgi:hypothetical protein